MKKNKIIISLIIILILLLIVLGIKNIISKKQNYDVKTTSKSTNTTIISTTTNFTTTALTTTSTTTIKPTTKTTTAKKETTTTQSSNNLSDLTGTSKKGYSIEYKNGAYYIGGYLIANKTYALASDFVPINTHIKITDSMDGFCKECIDETAYKAWKEMQSDAAAVGYTMWIQSGYRGYYYQRDLYNSYVNKKGQTAADKSSARAGHSEHQTGLAFDICVQGYSCISSAFNDTNPAIWLSENAYQYGYILRYPANKTDETGYMHESWHFRYVGKELAKALYNDGNWLTMEDYFGIDSKYQN